MTQAIPDLVLYDFPTEPGIAGWATYSPFVLEVERALNLAKLPFHHEHIEMVRLRRLNPVGQLPVLGIGGDLVADSTRILRRIEGLVPGSMTGGLDERGTAEVWLWEEFGDTALYPHALYTRWIDERGWSLARELFFGALPTGIRQLVSRTMRKRVHRSLMGRDFLRAGEERISERFIYILDALEARAPEEGFWLGPRCTAADLGLFAPLHQMRIPRIPWRAEEIARRQRLSRWLDRVDAATR